MTIQAAESVVDKGKRFGSNRISIQKNSNFGGKPCVILFLHFLQRESGPWSYSDY